jgi:succinate-semialdehyde dehydrogenase/glutarate-semialdehyde dehydrogenase
VAIFDQFETRFVAGMEALTIGDPMHETTEIGPLATAGLVETLDKQVKATLVAGAQILTGGERMLGIGNFFEPTVIAGLPRTAAVYRDEIFGPVALLFRVRDIAEAIEVANDTPFGLGASAWTRDPASSMSCNAAESSSTRWSHPIRGCRSAGSSVRAMGASFRRRECASL